VVRLTELFRQAAQSRIITKLAAAICGLALCDNESVTQQAAQGLGWEAVG
jgi:hypothetical protein